MQAGHNIGDIVMGVNQNNEKILGMIKTIDIESDDRSQWFYQIEWANDLHCGEWYRDSNVIAFKITIQNFLDGKELDYEP